MYILIYTLYRTDCTPCAPGTRAQSLCTANSDSICIPCSTCPPGFYVYELCTPDQDTLCMRKYIYTYIYIYISYTCIVFATYYTYKVHTLTNLIILYVYTIYTYTMYYTACSNCMLGTYISQSCSQFADTVCSTCSSCSLL